MTRADLRNLMLSYLDDGQSGYFDATTCNTWLNLAQREVQKELLQAGNNWYVRPVETITVNGQTDYVLPSDFMVEHRLELVISGTGSNENRQSLQPITINQQVMIPLALGTPSHYFIKKDRITILPTPQQAWTMRMYYSPRIADLANDSDTPDIPEQFMEMVAVIAAFDGFIKDDRVPANLMAKRAKYEEMFKKMAVDRTQDQPRMVVEVNQYEGGGWW